MSNEEEVVPRRVQIQREILNNVAATHGPDMANYAACCAELAQIQAIAMKLAKRETTEARAGALLSMLTILVSSVDTKIYPDLTLQERAEAGRAASLVIKAVEQDGG